MSSTSIFSFHFLRLRLDSHAQREIRDFANAMYELTKPLFPLSCEAFEDYILNGRMLSSMDVQALQDLLTGTFVPDPIQYGMSKREYQEFCDFWTPNNTSKLTG